MTKDTERILRQFAEALRRENIPLHQMFLFGSVARGKQHEWSDIDVAVVGPAFDKDRIEEMIHLQFIARRIHPALSPVPLRPDELQDRFSTIADAIRKEGQEVSL